MYKFIFYFSFSLCLVPLATYAEETLAWQDCVKEAAKNNPDLISAVENVSQQKAAKNITASTLFPQVSATLDASTAKTTTTSSSTGKTTKTIADSYSYGLTGSQLIFDGFTTINNVADTKEKPDFEPKFLPVVSRAYIITRNISYVIRG